MLTWLIYDISNDKIRNRVAKRCKEAGLYRVQKSVFLGDVEKNRLDELHLECGEMIEEKTDSLYVFPMCEEDFKKVKTAGNAFDRELVSDEILSMFF
ncbi:MAG: CRISPR-associated endonuclease Cas2 [Desulfococcaceae bacterium]|jgi:CRISPR-associated protein Cas2|nr:CRISPR-associated endonuclease Cas2 [Desulfococcaceae bacterium]